MSEAQVDQSLETSTPHDDHHHVNYMAVFISLCVLTALSVGFDLISFENKAVTVVIVLAIAAAKASCVLLFFMHLKFEGGWKYLVLAPTTVLALGLPLALWPDIGTHYYPSSAAQGQWLEEAAARQEAASK